MRSVPLLVLVAGLNAHGAPFVVEDPTLVPVPDTVAKAIARSETSAQAERFSVNCRFVGRTTSLAGAEQEPTDWIVTTADACMWAASAAPVWVVRGTARSHQVVLTHLAYTLAIGKHKTAGLADLKTSRGTAAREQEESWVFTGKHYRLVKRKVTAHN